ncbi:hypothetical protein ACQJBY_067045 [Aegilops geniculata]
MDEPVIFHLNFVKILEVVTEHIELDPPVISAVERTNGVGYQGAVHVQLNQDDENSYKVIYGYGEDAADASNIAAREALKFLHHFLNFSLVDLHMYEYWEVVLSLVQREQQHRMEMAQLHQYHEACRREELERLEQEHNDCVYEIKHDFELEIEDRDRWLELGEHKNKKLKQERDMLEEMTNKQESHLMELRAENRSLRDKLLAQESEANSGA